MAQAWTGLLIRLISFTVAIFSGISYKIACIKTIQRYWTEEAICLEYTTVILTTGGMAHIVRFCHLFMASGEHFYQVFC